MNFIDLELLDHIITHDNSLGNFGQVKAVLDDIKGKNLFILFLKRDTNSLPFSFCLFTETYSSKSLHNHLLIRYLFVLFCVVLLNIILSELFY